MLKGKKIILGITGGIAAYKCTILVRLLVKEGANVKVIMTQAAKEFVTPQTLSVLSKNKVYSEFFGNNLSWNSHVELAEWADLLIFAPLTANSLAKMASGQCDNLLLATYFSARSVIIHAPAMDLQMYKHPSVSKNLEILSKAGNHIIPPETGELASGLIGEGRMAEPETILLAVKNLFNNKLPLTGKKALVNAGPTYEPIDQVRFIGNRSSGKMGIAIAESLANQGAQVTLVLGPSHLNSIHPNVHVIRIETSAQMYDAMLKNYQNTDIVVCSAAVSDYTPEKRIRGKMKKVSEEFKINLIRTNDILLELGQKKQKQFLVGFALETENLLQNANKKRKQKNCDLIVANASNDQNPAFNSDYNEVFFVSDDNNPIKLGLKTKQDIATELVQFIIDKTIATK